MTDKLLTAVLWMSVGAIIIVLMWPACAADYWSNCETAYKFCKVRPYHRDCVVWTRWGLPLSTFGEKCPLPK